MKSSNLLYTVLVILTMLIPQSVLLGQSLPIDFEGDITTADFIDFDGGIAEVIANPNINADNESATVARIVRDGGQIWSGSKLQLMSNLDFTSNNIISMKVYTSAPVGTTVKFKLEGNGETERDAITTVSNSWETLTWDFTGAPNNFSDVVFMFDFGNVGNGSVNSTFLFDDVQQVFGGQQLDIPVTFEDANINYTTTDFGGNVSTLVQDPTAPTNNVIRVVKTEQAATWAGTTIGTPAGFASNIPLALDNSKMTVKVWSPAAGTPIRLKVEDHSDPTHTCETQTNTTKNGEWEIMEFDFNNQAQGTELLSVGLQMGWTYNMASIFFNFGTEGGGNQDSIYYFDEVKFGDLTSNTENLLLNNIHVFPNPAQDYIYIDIDNQLTSQVEIFDGNAKLVTSDELSISNNRIDISQLQTGIYFIKIWQGELSNIVKFIKE